MKVKFLWCSTLALEALKLSFMWCLMICSPQYLPLRGRLQHLTIGQNCALIFLDSPPEHLNGELLTEEELEIKRIRRNGDERIIEATKKRYGGASVNHPLGDSVSTEAQSQE
jgi:hypothetical protein